MRREEFESLCKTLESDREQFVENLELRYAGKVIACAADKLEVEAFGHHFSWPMEKCRKTDAASPLGPPSNA